MIRYTLILAMLFIISACSFIKNDKELNNSKKRRLLIYLEMLPDIVEAERQIEMHKQYLRIKEEIYQIQEDLEDLRDAQFAKIQSDYTKC